MKHTTIHTNQNGLVAIAVTMIFLSIMTLIVVSFAFLMRREQQQVLDRQLSTQAFYAAESGVNDAIYRLNAGPVGDIDNCDSSRGEFGEESRMLGDTDGVVEYTCVLINRNPGELVYDSVGTDRSQTIRLDASGNIGSIQISWEASDVLEGEEPIFATNPNYNLPTKDFNDKEDSGYTSDKPECDSTDPRGSFANSTGILRTMVIPGNSINRTDLTDNTRTFFLYPQCIDDNTNTTESVIASNTSTADNGRLVDGNCNSSNTEKTRHCSVIINLIPSSSTVFLNLKSIYQTSSVTIKAFSGDEGGGNELTFSGQQAVIDVTGRANDVLRRIQVRVSLRQTHDQFTPEFVLESMDDICKRLQTRPGSTSFGSPCENPNQ